MNKSIPYLDNIGNFLVEIFHRIALFTIGAITVWAALWTFIGLLDKSSATITDILLMFIYLEIGAMVGIYFKTNHMPVRFLLYIAITALTRHMVDIMSHLPINIHEMLAVSAAILIISLAVLTVRFTSYKFSNDNKDDIIK